MPVSDNVNIKMTAQHADALQAWKEITKGPEQMGTAMDRMGQKGKHANDTLGQSLDRMAAKWLSVQNGINIAQRALQSYLEIQRQEQRAADLANRTYDESFRRLKVQADFRKAGLTDQQVMAAANAAAQNTATLAPTAYAAATQAVSSGFNVKDILQGGGLESLLQFMAATNSQDQDPEQMVKAIGLFLGSTGQQLNSANLRRTLVGTQRLFKGTNLQASALSMLAREGSQITSFGNLSGDDSLSIMSVLLQQLGEEKGATAFRSTISDLSGLGTEKKKVRALGRMGLKPADVDMIGESFVDVLERIDTASKKLDPATRNLVMQQIFKQESRAGALALLSEEGRAQVAANRSLMGDEAGFMQDVAIATSGVSADKRRRDFREQQQLAAADDGTEALAQESRIKARDAGLGAAGAVAAEGIARYVLPLAPVGVGGMSRISVKLIDEDNRALPTEPPGKGIERQDR